MPCTANESDATPVGLATGRVGSVGWGVGTMVAVDVGVGVAVSSGQAIAVGVGVALGSGSDVAVAVTVGDAVSAGTTAPDRPGRDASAEGDGAGPAVDVAKGMLLGVAGPGSCQASRAPSSISALGASGAGSEGIVSVTVGVGLGRLHAICSWRGVGLDCSSGIPMPTARDIMTATRLRAIFCLLRPDSCHIHDLHQRLAAVWIVIVHRSVATLAMTTFDPCSPL